MRYLLPFALLIAVASAEEPTAEPARAPAAQDAKSRLAEMRKQRAAKERERAIAKNIEEAKEQQKRIDDVAAAKARALEAAEQARLADLARAPRGLFIVGFIPLRDGSGAAEVILVNRDNTPRKLEARELFGVQGHTGEIVPAMEVTFRPEERADLWLMPNQQRQFRVRFPQGRTIAALAWSADSTDWRTPGNPSPATESAEIAARKFREAEVARRVAERARMVGK